MERYCFRKYEELKNVVSMDQIEKNSDFLYEYFMQNKSDILYIMKDERLEAVSSPGDVHKFYIGEGKCEFAINKDFLFLEEFDYDKAQEIFLRISTIHEVPVIINHKFRGVIANDQCKTEKEWEAIRDDLKKCRMSKQHTQWLCADLIRWKQCFPDIKFFIYYIPSDKYLSPDQMRIRRSRIQSKYYGNYDEKLEAEKREGFSRLEYDRMRMTYNNGIYQLMDMNTSTCKISGGNRTVPNADEDAPHKIFVFGPCTMFGAYVDDSSTIEYFLQEKINNAGKSYQVCNCSMMGPEYCYHRMFTENIKEDDIVILALREIDFPYCYFDNQIRRYFQSDLSLLFGKFRDAEKMFLSCPAHCNDVMNKEIADVLFEDIKNSLADEKSTRAGTAMQDYYIGFDIRDYFLDYTKQYRNTDIRVQEVIGAVVMNCNPFTLGHRFLIERALEKVDYLYIFVVEENKSFFAFEDRMQMVKEGVRDIKRVSVVPSGKYIISKDTFAQYFQKEYVTEIKSMDYDVRIFGEIVVPEFHISYRFIGEEPFDMVTDKYNRTLKSILPRYGVKVEEIPRKRVKGREEMISATRVRNLVKLGDFEEIRQYCPESTIQYLRENLEI